ncbi:uncharacterized protein LOC142577973 [Dermacentor variabilis]|uniref:uncharacterized protein LOC142577973 n=1 Tax=Dermacentor variabilis TaxID=34621 RepID=UPI003F5CB45F
MAFHLTPLEDFTVNQLRAIAEQRNRNGFHAYYTGGFDASKKFFQVTCPSYMRSGCVFTTVFGYPAPSGRQGGPDEEYPISLGKFNEHERTFVKLFCRGTQQLKVEQRHNGNTMNLSSWTDRTIEGLHVLQFKKEEVNMQIPAFYNPNADFFFPHVNVRVDMGGYALWYGAWLPGIDVAALDLHGRRLAGAVQSPQLGEFRLLLKFYKDGCTLSNADAKRDALKLYPSFTSINLDQLFVKPNPVSFYEFKVVTGYINY